MAPRGTVRQHDDERAASAGGLAVEVGQHGEAGRVDELDRGRGRAPASRRRRPGRRTPRRARPGTRAGRGARRARRGPAGGARRRDMSRRFSPSARTTRMRSMHAAISAMPRPLAASGGGKPGAASGSNGSPSSHTATEKRGGAAAQDHAQPARCGVLDHVGARLGHGQLAREGRLGVGVDEHVAGRLGRRPGAVGVGGQVEHACSVTAPPCAGSRSSGRRRRGRRRPAARRRRRAASDAARRARAAAGPPSGPPSTSPSVNRASRSPAASPSRPSGYTGAGRNPAGGPPDRERLSPPGPASRWWPWPASA